MSMIKTAITLPEEILRDLDRAAKERGETRSMFIRKILAAALRARRDAMITRKLDELFADEAVREDQRRTLEEMQRASVPWDDEGW